MLSSLAPSITVIVVIVMYFVCFFSGMMFVGVSFLNSIAAIIIPVVASSPYQCIDSIGVCISIGFMVCSIIFMLSF